MKAAQKTQEKTLQQIVDQYIVPEVKSNVTATEAI